METGPKTCVCLSGQKVVFGPEKFITVPPQQYVTILNPVVIGKDGKVAMDANGQALLRHGDTEVRTDQAPFPLFPGEKLEHAVRPLPTVPVNKATRMEAIRDVIDEHGKVIHKVGEEWLEIGPKVLVPHPSSRIVNTISNYLIAPNEALHIRANSDLIDSLGKKRVAGEEYLVRTVGSYIPILDEFPIGKIQAHVLTPKNALHVRAKVSFVDQFEKQRKVGEEWLVTSEQTESFIPGVEETVISTVGITTLSNRDYCIVTDPYDPETGKYRFGEKEIRRGPQSFFHQPSEQINGPLQVTVLQEENALEIMALEKFEDDLGGGKKVIRNPGEVWDLVGPREYWPPLQAQTRYTLRPVVRIPALGIFWFTLYPVYVIVAVIVALLAIFFMYL